MTHYTISYARKELHLVSRRALEELDLQADVQLDEAEEEFTRAKILTFFETYNTILIVGEQADELFARFASEYQLVTAAGGVVTTPAGQALMIFRNGRWDLPKGRWEVGESLRRSAAREIEEETGVEPGRLVRRLCDTWHIYNLYGQWELKHTFWYHFEREQSAPPAPQQEEGITECSWCSIQEARRRAEESFPTLRAVMREL
jgi:8-oxo-dGTP pyrophosphatase MutT (NUDIX family)